MNPFGYAAFAVALFFLLGPLLRRFFPELEECLRRPRAITFPLWILVTALLVFGLVRLYATWRPELSQVLHFAVWDPH